MNRLCYTKPGVISSLPALNWQDGHLTPLHSIETLLSILNLKNLIPENASFAERIRLRLDAKLLKVQLGLSSGTRKRFSTSIRAKFESLFTFSEEPPKYSLCNAKPRYKSHYKELFSLMKCYSVQLNCPENLVKKEDCLSKIQCIGQKDKSLAKETYLLLVKQTRGNDKSSQLLNIWTLFLKITKTISLPKGISEFVIKYVQSVSENCRELVPVRQIARNILSRIAEDKISSSALSPVFWNIRECKVSLVDGRTLVLPYDSFTLVGDLIGHAAWTLGLESTTSFKIFKTYNDSEEMLDNNSSVSFVLATDSKMTGLAMKMDMIRTGFLEKMTNSVYRRLAFIQYRDEYLKRDYPISNETAVRCCALLIASQEQTSISNDKMDAIVRQFVPQEIYQGRVEEEWLSDVRKAMESIHYMDKTAAEVSFLEALYMDPIGAANIFSFEHIEPSVGAAGEIRCLVNRFGVYLYSKRLKEVVLNMDLSRIRRVDYENGSAMVMNWNTSHRKSRMTLRGKDALIFCYMLRTHLRDFAYTRESLLVRAADSDKSSSVGSSETTNSIEGFDWVEEMKDF